MTDAVVISTKELNRLRISARNEDQAANSRSEKNAELRRISEARYKTWDNTLEGLRRKKESERVQRLRDEEERQLAIDRENQAEEDARRAVIIQRAHRMADESDDSLRRMKGSLMLSDVLEERNRQIELKSMRKMKEKQRDIYFFSQTLDASEKMRQREVAEAAERERVNHQVQKDQLAQLQQYKDRWMTNKMAEIAEGERLKQAALDLIKEQEEKDRQAELLAEKRNRENTEANIKLEKIKADIMAKEQKEIDAIAFYAAEKDRKMKERKEQEEEAFRVKQAIRQKMIDDGVARLASFKSNEDSRLAGQQAQAEAAAEARAANDRAKQEQIQRELAESRADAVARKEAEKARNRKLEKEIEELRRRELAEFNAREAAAKEAKKQAGLQNQRYLAEQINQRESDQHRALMEREAYATELQQRNANAEEKARQYALNLVKDYAESGKNIKPLVRAVQKSMSKSLAGH